MNRLIKLAATLALAAAICAAGAFTAFAAPMPLPVLEVTASKVLGDTDPTTFSGNLQVNAKDASGNPIVFDLNGKSVTVTGDLYILGTLYVHGGTLTVRGSLTISNGVLKMTDANSVVSVDGNFTTAGSDHTGMLTTGMLEVRGDFMQYGAYSRGAYCPSGTFTTKLINTGKRVYFQTPDGSWLGNYTSPAGAWYNSDSHFSLDLSLSADTALTYPHLSVRGALNGHRLTVPDGTVVAGPLTLGGGSLYASGALTVGGHGGIGMQNAADYVEVAGNFTAGGHSNYEAGTLKVMGNFYQYSTLHGSSYNDDSYACLPAHTTQLVGTNKQVVFDTPGSSYFGQLVDTGVTYASGSTVSLNCDLTEDQTWSYPNLHYGGNMNGHALAVTGDLRARGITLSGGTLTVTGSLTAASPDCLVMQNAADHVAVGANFTSRFPMNPASMSAGLLEIGGSFYQLGEANSFTASGAHTTRLTGTGKYVSFANPGASYFNRLELPASPNFAPMSVLAMKCDLAGDLSLTVPTLYYSGNMGGHGLSVTGNLHLFGAVNPQGGSISATGNAALDQGGTLTMADDADSLTVDGDFTGAGSALLTKGSSEFRKSFLYTGSADSYWDASGTHMTTLSGGAGMFVVFDCPADSWFSRVTLSPGTTLSGDSALSVKACGQGDLALTVPKLYLQGNMSGDNFTLAGSLEVPAGSTLTIGGGNLSVSGDMEVDGLLEMSNPADIVRVGGSFTAAGPDETGKLTDGRLFVAGDFTQSGDSPKSFAATGNHATILDGVGAQEVHLTTPHMTDGSMFAKLYSLNTDVTFTNFLPQELSLSYTQTGDGLSSLSGSGGTLVPAFSFTAKNYDYIYVLPAGATSTTITAMKQSQNSTMTMNGDAVTSVPVSGVPMGGFVPVEIVVRAADDIVVSTYTVKVERLDASLSAIGLSAGTLSPSFNPNTEFYTVALPASSGSVTITPAAGNPDSTFTIGGIAAASGEYALKPGESQDVHIVVTGQDGSLTKTYTVRVTRGEMLSGISASEGSFSRLFSSSVQDYELFLPATAGTVTLTPQPRPGCSFTINGASQPGMDFSLPIGGEEAVEIVATAGSASFTYNVTIKRSAIISGFGNYPGATLTPAFDATGGTYTMSIPASTTTFNLEPGKADCSSLTINGQVLDSMNIIVPMGGSLSFVIIASAGPPADPTTVQFDLTIERRPAITAIAPSAGTLSPAFDPMVTEYTVERPATMEPMSLSLTLASGTAAVNGSLWDPLNPEFINSYVDPEPGGEGEFIVDAYDGAATIRYTVTVARQKPVTGISVSTGALTPAFSARTGSYIVEIPAYTSSVTVTPAPDASCTALTINGEDVDSIALSPPIGGAATAVVCATGADGVITTYTVVAQREGLLSDIKLSTGSLSPGFMGGVMNYSVYLPSTTTSVKLTPVKSPSCQSFAINGRNVSYVTLKPALGGSSTATVSAVGTGFGIYQTYIVTVYRIAPVTGIGLSSPCKLTSSFSVSKGSYTVNMPAYTPSVTITPKKGTSCQELKIDNVVQNSVAVPLDIGCSRTVTIAARAVNGQLFTYTVTVNRLALLSGITLSTGYELEPAFDVTKFAYGLKTTLPATVSSIKVTPRKGSGARYMKIGVNGATPKTASYTYLKPVIGGSATATIEVSNGTAKQTYTLTVHREPLITGLASSAGIFSKTGSADPAAFDPAITGYTVTLPADTVSTTLTAQMAPSGVQDVTIAGEAALSKQISVPAPGASVSVPVVGTATDGTTKVTYTVIVRRNPVLSGIALASATGIPALTPAFSPLTQNYTVSIPATVGSVTLTPVAGPECVSTSVGGVSTGVPAVGTDISVPIGGSVTVPVSGSTAGNSAAYNVTIQRAMLVTNLYDRVSSCTWDFGFSPTRLEYTLTMPPKTSSVTLYVSKATGVSVKMNGSSRTSLTVKPNIGCTVPVTIEAKSADGATSVTYTVNVTRAPLLSGITVDGGTLLPAFSPERHYYSVDLPAAEDSVGITAIPSEYAGTVKINGYTGVAASVAGLEEGESEKLTIVVYAQGSTVTKDTYTVVVTRDPALSGIDVAGGTLSPYFSPPTENYTVSLPATVGSVTLTPVPGPECASISVNGNPTSMPPGGTVIDVPIGGSVTVPISGTTTSGNTDAYNVTVKRAALVTNLYDKVSSCTWDYGFSATRLEYTLTMPATTSTVTLYATKASSGVKSLTINGSSRTSLTVKPGIGCTVPVVIEATASDGVTKVAYTVNVKRVALLDGIDVTGGSALSPAFSTDRHNYAVDLPAAQGSVTVAPRMSTNGRKFTINGQAVSTRSVALEPGDSEKLTIVVYAKNSTTIKDTYTVVVSRDPALSGIDVAGGALSPYFSPLTGSYTVSLPATTGSVTLTPVPGPECDSISVNGNPTSMPPGGTVIDVPIGGSVTVPISGTTDQGNTDTYNVTVKRAALVTNLYDKLASCTWDYGFSATRLEYTLTMPATTSAVNLYVSKASSGVKSLTMNGSSRTSLTVRPGIGCTVPVVIEATASDGTTKVAYTVNVKRVALLDGIDVTGGGALSPAFSPERHNYAVDLPAAQGSVTVAPRMSTNGRKFTINGQAVSSRLVALGAGNSEKLTIVVYAKNSTTIKDTYTVVVSRDPALSGIDVAGGTLSPYFSPLTGSYTVSLPATVGSVTLTPVPGPECASTSVNGVSTGLPPVGAVIDVPIGGSVTVPVSGTTDQGNTDTYNVTVKRAALVTNLYDKLTSCTWDYAFSPTRLEYTLSMPASTSSVNLYVSKASSGVKSLTMNGSNRTYMTVRPAKGETIVVTVVATASDGVTMITYTVFVARGS